MSEPIVLSYVIQDPIELNLSYMPFISDGGLFVPTTQPFTLGDKVLLDLQLPGKKEPLQIEGRIVWLTPSNALHQVVPGVGVQFVGSNVMNIRSQIEALLDTKVEIGGYTYGITEVDKSKK